MDLAVALREALPGLRASDSAVDVAAAARDVWPRHLIAGSGALRVRPEPALVVWPEHSEQVEALVAFARRSGTSLVTYGAGSGVCGAVLPAPNAIVVDTKRLTRMRVLRDHGVVEVEAGVLGVDLEAALARQGLTVGHFPSSILCSTVGGWLAARGAGQCSSRFGKIEDMTRSVDCVLGTGQAVRLQRHLAGPNPLGLMIGSEGTLGVITSARLQLHPAPRRRAFAAFALPSFEVGADAMRLIMQAGLRPEVMRLYDPIDSWLLSHGRVEGDAGEASSGKKMPGNAWLRRAFAHPRWSSAALLGFERFVSSACTLVTIFEAADEAAQHDSDAAARLLQQLGARPLGEAPARSWLAHRHSVSYWQSKVFQMGCFNDTLEVALPWARLPQVYAAVRRAVRPYAVALAHISHPYPDGCCIYFTLLGSRQGDALARYDALIDAALGAALAEGATLSHHHGVGVSKAHFLDAELGGGLETLRRLRRAWDPDALLNPATFEPARPVPSLSTPEPVPGIDSHSGIASYRGDTPLVEIEAAARRYGLSLGLTGSVPSLSLAAFVEAGLPGLPDPFGDPVRTAVCGLTALGPRARFQLAPAPRRATGPDLMALCIGAQRQVASVVAASLALVPAALPAGPASSPTSLSEGERTAWQRVVAAFAATSS